MEKVTGRCDDMIILRGVNLFPSQIEEIVLRAPGVAPHFQLLLTRRGRLDRLTVRVEARPSATARDRARAALTLTDTVKERIGLTVEVDVVDPGTLERSAGKLSRVVDTRRN